MIFIISYSLFNSKSTTESLVLNANINGSEVATGSLISYLQKGLQYKEIETHLGEVCIQSIFYLSNLDYLIIFFFKFHSQNGKEINCTEEFNLLTPHVCQVKKKDEKGANAAVKKEIREVTDQEVQVLNGHSGEVFIYFGLIFIEKIETMKNEIGFLCFL